MTSIKKCNELSLMIAGIIISKGGKTYSQVIGVITTPRGQDRFGAQMRHDSTEGKGDLTYAYATGGEKGCDGGGCWSGSGQPGGGGYVAISPSKAVASGGGGGGGGGGGYFGGSGGVGGKGGDSGVRRLVWDKTGVYGSGKMSDPGSTGRRGQEGGWLLGGAGGGGGRGGNVEMNF